MRGAFFCLVNHPLSISIPLRHNFLITLLCFCQFLSDLLGIELAFFDSFPTLFKHSQNRLISEAPEQERDNAKANHLGEEELPVPTESLGGIAQHVTEASARRSNHHVHKL